MAKQNAKLDSLKTVGRTRKLWTISLEKVVCQNMHNIHNSLVKFFILI